MRRFQVLLFIVFIITVGQEISAQLCGTQLGRLPVKPYGGMQSSAVSGNYTYAPNGLFLTVLDISNPAAPAVVRELDLPGEVGEGEILIAGGYLFIPISAFPTSPASLKIFSLADPANPVEVGELSGLTGMGGGMELNGGLLYAADMDGGLVILDVSPPATPSLVGSLPLGMAALDVALYPTALATYAYVADYYEGIFVADVTNPALPVRLDPEMFFCAGSNFVARSGEYLFTSDEASGLVIFSLADPTTPTLLASLPLPGYAEWATISGTKLFVCCGTAGLCAVDISAPSSPSIIGTMGSTAYTMHIALGGATAMVSEFSGGIRLVDVTDPAAMAPLGVWDISEGPSYSLCTQGSQLYVARLLEGLALLDASAPGSPSQNGIWPRPGETFTGITISGTTGYLSSRSAGLFILDVSSPSSPQLLGSFTNSAGFNAAVFGNYAYLATASLGLIIVDVSDPANPVQVSRYNTPGSSRWLDLVFPYAFVADRAGGLRVIDVSAPEAPIEVGHLDTPDLAVGVKVLGGRAYVGASTAGLRVIDVSNPAAPFELGFYDTPGTANRVDVSGSVAIVSDGTAGVQVLDVSNPSAPYLMGTIDTPGLALETRIIGDNLAIADYFGVIIESLANCCSGISPVGLVAPASGATIQACSMIFDWEDAAEALRYDFYLDTQDPPLALAAGGLKVSSFEATLPPGTTYFWKVVAHNGCGSSESATWSLTTAGIPGVFDLQAPVDGVSRLTTTTAMRWSCSENALSYDLYLSTNDPPPLYASGLTGTDTIVSGLLPGTTYYWTVHALSPCGETQATGGVRSFTTACPIQLGRWPEKSHGPLRSLAVSGNYAYFTNGLYLTVVDISNPGAPYLANEIMIPVGTGEGEPVIDGGYLYLPLSYTTLKVYSLADPTTPVEVGSLAGFSGFQGGMELEGGKLYAADGAGGLRIIDVSVPTSPTLLGSYTTSMARDVAVYQVGPTIYAYVGNYNAPLLVLDVTDPAAPSLVATLPLDAPEEVESITRVDDLLYVADGEWGMRIFSLTNPASPVQLSFTPPVEYFEWLSVSNDSVYLCDSSSGLKVFNVTDPTNPTAIGQWDNPGYSFFTVLDGSTAYLADDFAGLRIIDVSDPGSMVEKGFYDDFIGEPRGVAAGGTTAFLASNLEGLVTLDISSPSNTTHLASLPSTRLWSASASVALRDNVALVSDLWGGLRLVDVSVPSAPVELGWDGTCAPRNCAALGNYAYLAAGGQGLVILDISDVYAPARVGQCNTPGSAQWVAIQWPLAFLADGALGLRVIDASDPANPFEIGSAPVTDLAYGVALADGVALVAANGAGLRLFDISNPTAPFEIGSYATTGWSRRVQVSGSVAALADGYGAKILDISNPSSPILLGSFDTTPGNAFEAAIFGDRILVADILGVYIEDLSTCCSGGPGAVSLSSPPDGATGYAADMTFDWGDAYWALRYDLYVDTENPPAQIRASGLTLSKFRATLMPGTTYYWKVVAHNPCGSSESPVYSVTTGLPDLSIISYSASPTPILTGGQVTFSLSFTNLGVNPATGATVTEFFSLDGTAGITFEPGSSDPRLMWDAGNMTLTANLGTLNPGGSDSLAAVFTTSGVGAVSGQVALAENEADANTADNTASASAQVEPLSIGDRVWRDDDADGVQDPGEPGIEGAVVDLYDSGYNWLRRVLTNPSGAYQFTDLTFGATYIVKYFLPSSDFVFSPADRGSDDLVDSDASTTTGQTQALVFTDGLDPVRWDCGMVPGALCVPPDETVFIYSVTLTGDGNNYPILNFMDPNQPEQRTGYNIYRTENPALPHAEWQMLASDVVDMDEAAPNRQWIDTTGQEPPQGEVWYYEVSAYNHHCATGGEGPW